MAIVLTQSTVDLYNKISKDLKGLDGFLVDPTDPGTWRSLYEAMRSRPALKLKADVASGDMKIRVQTGHLYPPTGTILISDEATSTYESLTYKRVVNDTVSVSNAPPSYNGLGNPPGGYLLLESAVVGAAYAVATTKLYLVSSQISGVFPVNTGSYMSSQNMAAFLKLLKKELAPASNLLADAGSTTEVSKTAAFGPCPPYPQVGNKVTIVDTTDGLAPKGESAYVVSHDADTLTVEPAFTAAVELGDTFSIEVTFFDRYIEALEKDLPHKYHTNGTWENGVAENLCTLGGTLPVAAMVFIVGQLGGTVPTEEEDRTRKQIGVYTPPFTTLRKPGYIGDSKLYVTNASQLPQPAHDEDGVVIPEELTLVGPSGTATVNMIRNNMRKNGSGEESVDLDTSLVADAELPCYVYWIKTVPAEKKNQFVVSNPKQTPQAAIPGFLGLFQYFESMKVTVENSTVPS